MPTEPTVAAPKLETSLYCLSGHHWRWHVWIKRSAEYAPDTTARSIQLDGSASSRREARAKLDDAKRRVRAAWAALGGEEPRG